MAKRKDQLRLHSFFLPVSKQCRKESDQETSTDLQEAMSVSPTGTEEPASPDIANYTTKVASAIPDQVKYSIIKERKPSLQVKIPTRSYNDSSRSRGTYQRQCNREWFDMFPFLAYSRSTEGLYCLACVLFPTSCEDKGASRPQYLITKPYTNWKDGKSHFAAHANLHYHQYSEAKLKAFVSTMENPSLRVDLALTNESQQLVTRNRTVLTSIIKCLEYCGRQGIALRGHRDDSTSDDINKGKFRALIDFRIESGDVILKDFLEKNSAKNATYLSKTSQNDLLDCIGEFILTKIITEVKANQFFGLEADEVTDTSGWEQLGLALRYVKNNEPVERVVNYIACESVSGADICKKYLMLWLTLELILSSVELKVMMELEACQVI